MDEDPDRAWTIREIRTFLKRSKGSIRVGLSRYRARGRLERVDVGVYRSVMPRVRPALPDPRVRVHGIHISCNVEGGRGVPSLFQRLTHVWGSPVRHRLQKRTTDRADWRGRELTWTLHDRGALDISLRASDRPLTFPELYAYFLTVETVTGIPLVLWRWDLAGYNIDGPGKLGFELAARNLSIEGMGEAILRVYQKTLELVRADVHVFHVLSVQAAADYFAAVLRTIEGVTRGSPSISDRPEGPP